MGIREGLVGELLHYGSKWVVPFDVGEIFCMCVDMYINSLNGNSNSIHKEYYSASVFNSF